MIFALLGTVILKEIIKINIYQVIIFIENNKALVA